MKITINEILVLLLIIALVIWTYYPLIYVVLKKEKFSNHYNFEESFKNFTRLLFFILTLIVVGIFLIGWFIIQIGTISLTI